MAGTAASGSIRLERARTPWTDRARAYKVMVDGVTVGDVRFGETETFPVAPGPHVVQLRIDWGRSEPLRVEVPAGGEARLTCRGRNPFLGLYWATIGRSKYVVLEHAASGGPITPG